MRQAGDRRLFVWGAAALGAMLGARAIARRASEPDLEGRTVLITGGSRGLGLLLAREATRQGARVALCARDPEELDRAVAELDGRGATAYGIPCDLANPEQIRVMVRKARSRFGRIDVLINNAGTIQVGPMETMTTDDYENALKLHFWASFHAVQAVLPEMGRGARGAL